MQDTPEKVAGEVQQMLKCDSKAEYREFRGNK